MIADADELICLPRFFLLLRVEGGGCWLGTTALEVQSALASAATRSADIFASAICTSGPSSDFLLDEFVDFLDFLRASRPLALAFTLLGGSALCCSVATEACDRRLARSVVLVEGRLIKGI